MKTTLFFCLIVLSSNCLFGQEIISSAGQNYENSKALFAFTLGEPIIETNENNSLKVTQGFHQPIPRLNSTSINDSFKENSFHLSIFPNPTTNYITLQYTLISSNQSVHIFLTDVDGRQIFNKKIGLVNAGTFKETISTLSIPDGIYHLSLKNGLITESIPLIITH